MTKTKLSEIHFFKFNKVQLHQCRRNTRYLIDCLNSISFTIRTTYGPAYRAVDYMVRIQRRTFNTKDFSVIYRKCQQVRTSQFIIDIRTINKLHLIHSIMFETMQSIVVLSGGINQSEAWLDPLMRGDNGLRQLVLCFSILGLWQGCYSQNC